MSVRLQSSRNSCLLYGRKTISASALVRSHNRSSLKYRGAGDCQATPCLGQRRRALKQPSKQKHPRDGIRHAGIVDVRFSRATRWEQPSSVARLVKGYQFLGCMNHHHLSVLVLNRRFQFPSFHSSVD